MSVPAIDMIDAEEAKKYDYIRFTFADVNGVSRSKVVKKKCIEKYLQHGMGLFEGVMGFPITADLILDRLITTRPVNNGDVSVLPQAGTLHPVPSASTDEFNVGEVLCETSYVYDGSIQESCPRYVARKQLDALRELGYELFSGFEVEFLLYDAESNTPVFDAPAEALFNPSFTKNNELLYKIDQHLEASGIDLEILQTEYSPGQFELATTPQIGIKAADNMFMLKDIVKEVANKRGKQAIFMTKPFVDMPAANGLHFNMSLKDMDGNNAFSDTEDENRMSKVFYHWMAGILKHSSALTALCCPTVNCYRRIHRPHASTPCNITWGVDDRIASYRAKTISPYSTYMENRLPGGSANSYLIVAANVAAGMDGLKNKLECPRKAQYKDGVLIGDAQQFPRTLSEALAALDEDLYMVDALGEEFVKWFNVLKKYEIEKLVCSNVETDGDCEENFAKERKLYMKFL